MAKHTSISRRIAGDRGVAGFFAFIAALPALAAVVGLLYVGYRVIVDPNEDLSTDGGYAVLALVALFAFLFFIVARWTYDSVHAAMTPQRVQAMWLRRFQAEGAGAFRTSRVIDRLSRFGISALTLQDRDVQLSFEQRRNRLAPMFWLLFIPIALAVAYLLWNGWVSAREDIMDLPQAESLQQGVGQVIGAFIGLLAIAVLFVAGFFFAIMATLVAVMLIAALAGPIGAVFSRNRDDFKALPALLRRFNRGKRRGAQVLRISDTNWRAAVTSSLGAADVAIIDLSDVSDHVAWEIAEAAKACGSAGLVFICRDGVQLSDAAKAAVRGALGRELIGVVHYPATRNSDGKAFARDLREHIYNAADLRQAQRA